MEERGLLSELRGEGDSQWNTASVADRVGPHHSSRVYNVNEPPELHAEARRSRQVGDWLLLYRKHSSSAEERRERLLGRGELGGY